MTENKRYSFNWERGHPNFWDNHCDVADCYLTCEDVVNKLNDLHYENVKLLKENEELKKQNQGIQDKVMRLLDYVEIKQCVTRTEIKKWWNSDVE